MQKIEPPISKYIDIAIERERKIFNKDMEHFMSIQREILQDDVKKLAELLADRPTRSEVRQIVREEMFTELRPIRAEMSMFREELLDHRTRIEAIESVRT